MNKMKKQEMEKVLYEAALKAAKDMGPELLKMSCFVSNWKDQTNM